MTFKVTMQGCLVLHTHANESIYRIRHIYDEFRGVCPEFNQSPTFRLPFGIDTRTMDRIKRTPDLRTLEADSRRAILPLVPQIFPKSFFRCAICLFWVSIIPPPSPSSCDNYCASFHNSALSFHNSAPFLDKFLTMCESLLDSMKIELVS
jgi:hypothetical protein